MAVLAAMAVACAGLHGNKLSLMSHVDHVRGSGRTRRMNKIYTIIINKESEKLLLIIIWEKIPPPREPDPG